MAIKKAWGLLRRVFSLVSMLQRPMVIAVVALSGMLAVGTAGYVAIEGWRPLDAIWMVLITLTTIDFGEVHPLSDAGRIFTMALIVSGLTIGGYTMKQLTEHIVEGKMALAFTLRRRRRLMESLNDHFIVVGYGRLGQTIVEELQASGVAVCVVEREAAPVALLEARGLPVVHGDGSSDEVLRRAGIGRARGLAVAVSSSAEAVYVTLSARELQPELNIVTRVADSGHALKAKRAGATSVVSPHTMGGWRIAHGLVRPHASSFLDLATLASLAEFLLGEIAVTDTSPVAHKTIGDMRLGDEHHVLIVAIRRADGAMIATPSSKEILSPSDVLIAIGAPKNVQALECIVRGV